MRYMLLIYRDQARWEQLSTHERVAAYEAAVEYSEGLRRLGVYRSGDPLQPASTAATVRMKSGTPVRTDGPFAETKEQLGGYSIVETSSLEEALSIADRHPLVRAGHSIEVRAIREGPPP